MSFGNAPVVQLILSSVWTFIHVLWQCSSCTAYIEFCVDVYSCPLAMLWLYSFNSLLCGPSGCLGSLAMFQLYS